jgi:hypothetical protein
MRTRVGIALWVASTCALGCESAGGSATTTGPSDEGTSSGSSTTGGGTTFADAVPCSASAECSDGVCVAPYDPGAGPGSLGMGAPVCVPSCVPEDALELWCIDDASCCEGLECSAIDGFCVGPGGTSTDGTVGETWVVDSSSEGDGTSTQSSGSTTSGGTSGTESTG